MDTFLCGVAEKWHDLRCLVLSGMRALSSHTFAQITLAWSQLKVLGLYGETITDENLTLIADHLRMLTCLKLTDGHYTPSGIKKLCGHPSIERLYLLEKHQKRPSSKWLLAVYDVILSLPRITYVKMLGNRLIALHAILSMKVPQMTRDIHIEVENSEIAFERHWWMDRRHCHMD